MRFQRQGTVVAPGLQSGMLGAFVIVTPMRGMQAATARASTSAAIEAALRCIVRRAGVDEFAPKCRTTGGPKDSCPQRRHAFSARKRIHRFGGKPCG